MDKVEEDYNRVTAELDAREILRYLNELGIHNISGEVLKHFITDLKKLIKLDLQRKHGYINEDIENQGVERLHSASTFCSRLRSKNQEKESLTCSREDPKCHRVHHVRRIHSAPVLVQNQVDEKPLKRACSCIRTEKKVHIAPSKSTTSSGNLIKIGKQEVMKKCDPVSLYHNYMALWAKYKSNLPGENNWADLRWEMRQKMAGSSENNIHKKVMKKQKGKKDNKV